MQDSTGLQAFLKIPFIYYMFQEIVGTNAFRKKVLKSHIKPRKGDKVVDIGCGPAQMFAWMPEVFYVGFDISEAYIGAAKKQYGSKGTFLAGDTKSLKDEQRLQRADIVLCSTILHHLDDDEVLDLMRFSSGILNEGGKLVCIEPCWVKGQSALSRWVMIRDRGKNIRDEAGYRKLAAEHFGKIDTTIHMTPCRVPTTCIVMDCTK